MRLGCVLVCVFSIPCLGTGVPPTIDGFLDDPFWANNARVWTTYGPDLPDHSARFQIGFDAEAIYFSADVTDPDLTGAELEDTYVTLVQDVRKQVSIPLAVKLSPFFSALPNFARRLAGLERCPRVLTDDKALSHHIHHDG